MEGQGASACDAGFWKPPEFCPTSWLLYHVSGWNGVCEGANRWGKPAGFGRREGKPGLRRHHDSKWVSTKA